MHLVLLKQPCIMLPVNFLPVLRSAKVYALAFLKCVLLICPVCKSGDWSSTPCLFSGWDVNTVTFTSSSSLYGDWMFGCLCCAADFMVQ